MHTGISLIYGVLSVFCLWYLCSVWDKAILHILYNFFFQNDCQIWAKDLKDGSKALVLYNSVRCRINFCINNVTLCCQGGSSQSIGVDFSKYFKWSSVNMMDLWTHKDMGVVKGRYAHIMLSTIHYLVFPSFSTTVESHGVEAYRIRKA